MASKKNIPTGGLPTLKIGSRVRCTDNGLVGRIVWANGVSVKITWDDGQQVTWRRDSLADRPIEIFAGDDGQTTHPAPAAVEPDEPLAIAPVESPAVKTPATPPETAQEPPATETPASAPIPMEAAPEAAESSRGVASASRESASTDAANASATTEAGPTVAKPKRPRQSSAGPTEKKRSALDAAAQVLAEVGQPMGCREMIAVMATKGYWTSPGGQTPEATLYSALLREITTKGEQARFVKAGRGKFALRPRT